MDTGGLQRLTRFTSFHLRERRYWCTSTAFACLMQWGGAICYVWKLESLILLQGQEGAASPWGWHAYDKRRRRPSVPRLSPVSGPQLCPHQAGDRFRRPASSPMIRALHYRACQTLRSNWPGPLRASILARRSLGEKGSPGISRSH